MPDGAVVKDPYQELKDRIDRGEVKFGKPLGLDGTKKTNKKATAKEKPKIPDGYWLPIEFENDVPIAYAGWHDGSPAILRIKVSTKVITEDRKKITLRDHDGSKIRDRIKRLKINGMDMVEFDGEIFTKSQFVNSMVYPQNCNLFTECLNALPVDPTEYREPKMYMENGHILFPQKFYARRDDSYQRILKNALNVGHVDPEIYQEGINLLRNHPKQITLHYAIIGANVINVKGHEDYLITIDALGDTDAGKSFAVDVTMKLDYGIWNAIIQDDALSSGFRHHAIAGSTNLPVYIEEALMDKRALTRLKSVGKNIRGNSDKSLSVYDVQTTFIFSRNTESEDMKNLDLVEKKAQDKRIYKFVFDKDDVITSNEEKIKGTDFLNKIKQMPGGMLYERLKDIPVMDIINKYKELKARENDGRKVISLLGAWIMGDTDFIPTVAEIKPPTILDEFFSVIIDLWYRIKNISDLAYDPDYKVPWKTQQDNAMKTNLYMDESTGEFRISAHGFNLVKREFGYSGSAKSFAESYGFKYDNLRILGTDNKGQGFMGDVPDGTFENEDKDEPKKDSPGDSSDEHMD